MWRRALKTLWPALLLLGLLACLAVAASILLFSAR